jgi:hypothetical protein
MGMERILKNIFWTKRFITVDVSREQSLLCYGFYYKRSSNNKTWNLKSICILVAWCMVYYCAAV